VIVNQGGGENIDYTGDGKSTGKRVLSLLFVFEIRNRYIVQKKKKTTGVKRVRPSGDYGCLTQVIRVFKLR